MKFVNEGAAMTHVCGTGHLGEQMSATHSMLKCTRARVSSRLRRTGTGALIYLGGPAVALMRCAANLT
jgi:hypothetical protein